MQFWTYLIVAADFNLKVELYDSVVDLPVGLSHFLKSDVLRVCLLAVFVLAFRVGLLLALLAARALLARDEVAGVVAGCFAGEHASAARAVASVIHHISCRVKVFKLIQI